MSIQIDKSRLLGRWQIREWIQHYDDGRQTYPLGRDLKGFLHYDGSHVFCFLCSADRKPLTGAQWTAPDSEKAAAYSNCLVYSGTYDVSGAEILHRIEMSLYPNWVGTTQRRRAKLEGVQLTLTARLEDGTPDARTALLTWERQVI
jgi:hypothetical protein